VTVTYLAGEHTYGRLSFGGKSNSRSCRNADSQDEECRVPSSTKQRAAHLRERPDPFSVIYAAA
jgi:hypothetical protein